MMICWLLWKRRNSLQLLVTIIVITIGAVIAGVFMAGRGIGGDSVPRCGIRPSCVGASRWKRIRRRPLG